MVGLRLCAAAKHAVEIGLHNLEELRLLVRGIQCASWIHLIVWVHIICTLGVAAGTAKLVHKMAAKCGKTYFCNVSLTTETLGTKYETG